MRLIALYFAVFVQILCVSRLGAQDSVSYQVDPAKPVQTRTGTIVDYNNKILTIKIGDNQRRIPASQVRQVSTRYTTPHLRGDEQLASKNYVGAIKFFREALDQEPRPWVQRVIQASLVQTLRENGNWLDAAKVFASMLSNESECRFFSAIPVPWLPINPNVNRTVAAEKWMGDSDEILALMGCSFLMSTMKREQAIERLQKLKQSKDPRVARIATMQIWRSRMLVADASEVKSWQRKLEKFPEPVRYGGYFVITGAYANNPKLSSTSRDLAAVEAMRIPILFPTQHRLSASALHTAAKLLQTSNPQGAKKILQELAVKFPNTEFGKSAGAQLKK